MEKSLFCQLEAIRYNQQFIVPKDYFETLPGKILNKIKELEHKESS